MAKSYIFSSESVPRVTRDKVADTISDRAGRLSGPGQTQPRRPAKRGEIEPRRRRRGNHDQGRF